jgi:hypothetical protein
MIPSYVEVKVLWTIFELEDQDEGDYLLNFISNCE